MPRNAFRFFLLLIALAVIFSPSHYSVRGYAESESALQSLPEPTPPPKSTGSTASAAPPWYDDNAIAEASKKLDVEKERLGIAITEILEEAKGNQKGQDAIMESALPKLGELEKALALEKVTEGEIQAHDGRCHNGQLPQAAYDACLVEHEQVWSKYKGQVDARKSLAQQIMPLQTKLKELEAKDKEYEARFNKAVARIKEIEKQQTELAKLAEIIQGCDPLYRESVKPANRNKPGIEEGLKYCYAKIWDAAAPGLPPLPANPQASFAASPNGDGSGDASVVDTRGVKKMTDEERKAELAKPGVQPPKGRGGAGSAPPKP